MNNLGNNIINVVSGKGGTGKTLLSAILAEMLANAGARVLVVDLDVFVRGLTALLYFNKEGSLKVSKKGEWTISDIFTRRPEGREWNKVRLSLQRYNSFTICPSVPEIDTLLNFNDLSPNTRDESLSLLDGLLSDVNEQFDYVILDSRAGYDEIIAATHLISNISICVQEDDNISSVTANNLIKQLNKDSENSFSDKRISDEHSSMDYKKSETKLFRIVNKVRGIESEGDLRKDYGMGFEFLGAIPFDIDVMNAFGKISFWKDIEKTLYKQSLIKIWNNLAIKMDFKHFLKSEDVSPLINESFEKRFGRFSTSERLLILYFAVFTLFGSILFTIGSDIAVLFKDSYRVAGAIMLIMGVIIGLYIFLKPSR